MFRLSGGIGHQLFSIKMNSALQRRKYMCKILLKNQKYIRNQDDFHVFDAFRIQIAYGLPKLKDAIKTKLKR